jgi:hypothetical protein
VKKLNSDELHEVIHRALDEVDRQLASGKLDGSGRYYTAEELAAGAATGTIPRPQRKIGPSATRPQKRRSAVSG